MASEMSVESSGEPPKYAKSDVPPWWLRPTRAVAGIGLLTLAWGAIMAVFWLGSVTLAIPPHRHVVVRIVLYVLGAAGTCWLGLTALASVLVGAFCLMLALTSRRW
ncbi:MAG TPA: hypothetical protein VF818_02965 [Ktedonobacterales bacterium]